MTFTAFFLVFTSAFLHAGWNFLSKKQIPSLAFYSLSSATAALLCLPGFLYFKLNFSTVPITFWWIFLCSVIFEFLYLFGLAHAYRRAEITLVYPLARALPVLLTAGITGLFGIGSQTGLIAIIGMVVLSIGCLLMPLKELGDFRLSLFKSKSLAFIIIASIGTTGYTILDSMAIGLLNMHGGISSFGCSITYLFMIELGLVATLIPAVAMQNKERVEFKKLFLKTIVPHISGLFSASAYILVLIAMNFVSNVSYIQAFRQMSLPLGVMAGIFLLKERPHIPRLMGIILVLVGLLVIAFGA